MIENPSYQRIDENLSTRYPLKKTDRKLDLNRLLNLKSSFCIFSKHRNGITTLLKDFAIRVNGIYIDSMSLSRGDEAEQLERIVGSENRPFLLDDAVVLFKRLGEYERAITYLQRKSEKMQVGIRLHPESNSLKDDLKRRGFEIVELGKISYEEFKAIIDSQFAGTGFLFPERFVQYAHTNYEELGKSTLYVAEAFRTLIENPSTKVSEREVQKSVESKYLMFRTDRM